MAGAAGRTYSSQQFYWIHTMQLAILVLYMTYVVFALSGGWRKHNDGRHSRLSWMLAIPTVIFIALWWTGLWFWRDASYIWLGGGSRASHDTIRAISGGVALIVSMVVIGRMITGTATRSYLLRSFFGAIAFIALVGAMKANYFVSGIDGWTAREAAENVLAERPFSGNALVDPAIPIRLEQSKPSESNLGQNREGAVGFTAYQKEQPLLQIVVVPYKRHWWQYAGSKMLIPSPQVWKNIDRHWDTAPQLARQELEELIKKYPNSETERKTRELLGELERDHPQELGSQRRL